MAQKFRLKDGLSRITRRDRTYESSQIEQERFALAQPKPKAASSAHLTHIEKEIATILVMGRSGSGKTQFIKTICPTLSEQKAKTLEVQPYPCTYYNREFRLVDTPGFDNMDISDVKALTKITQYLLHRDRIERGITGIIFLHPAGDILQSKTLQQNLDVLMTLFLGEEVHRLTILVTPGNIQRLDLQAAVDRFYQYDSRVFEKLRKGAVVRPITHHQSRIGNVLHSYCMMHPIAPPIRHMNFDNMQLSHFIEKNFGSHEEQSLNWMVSDYERQIAELRSLGNSQDPTPESVQIQKERDRIEGLYIDLQKSNMVLQRQLQQVQKEHASLQSQVQTQCTYDWNAISENLDDINTLLKRIGQSISDDLSDRYILATFGKQPAEVTTLDAHDKPQLVSWLGYDEHVVKNESLIWSSEQSIGLDAETFFDFSIRAQLCARLLSNIFTPFHPLLESFENDSLTGIYRSIKQQESQYMVGRWRSTTFACITKSKGSSTEDKYIAKLAQDFVLECLNPLVVHFFGFTPGSINWDEQLRAQVHQLFATAYKWNARLKEDVILLGEFEPTAPSFGSNFDGTQMENFNPSPGAFSREARTVLAPLSLGITVREAMGGGNPPKSTIVHKAMVATDVFYLL
ncbi:unnamed protein product [Rhizoctonia solani]|uniref:G domain-containing protein n=1 Tax=Rhizoctonia solani TaxID=456999 RepID=A0A8H3AHI2_9AGAM|nr:unnamed protein product [Rhizoctonia solani]